MIETNTIKMRLLKMHEECGIVGVSFNETPATLSIYYARVNGKEIRDRRE